MVQGLNSLIPIHGLDKSSPYTTKSSPYNFNTVSWRERVLKFCHKKEGGEETDIFLLHRPSNSDKKEDKFARKDHPAEKTGRPIYEGPGCF